MDLYGYPKRRTQQRAVEKNERINRRIETLVDKAFAWGDLDGIDVALIICKHGQYTTYKSRGFLSRQPSFTKIVSRAVA